MALFILSCSHDTRSPYQSYKKHEGYREKNEEGERIINFRGNSYTKTEEAQLFASFRAIEICLGEGKKMAHIMDVVDKTQHKEIIRSSGNTYYPSYYYGMSPYYSRYSSFGFSTAIGNTNTSSWKETITLPEIEVVYDCVDQAWGPEIILKDVSAEQMKLLVKDLKGGLQIEKILESSPNKKQLEAGDIILKGNGVRLERNLQIQKFFNTQPFKRNMKLTLLREGEKKTSTMSSKDISNSIISSQNEVIKKACELEEMKKIPLCVK